MEAKVKVSSRKERAPNWSNQEDMYLARSFVSCTEDPIKGADQKASSFWIAVHNKFVDLYCKAEDIEVKDEQIATTRNWESMKNRFQRHIQKDLNVFNKYYKGQKEVQKSGWKEQDYIDAAIASYAAEEGKPFRFPLCVEVLQQLPKFNPMIESTGEEEDNEDDTVYNKIGRVMGDGLDRPMGAKAAKAAKKEKREKQKRDATSILSMESTMVEAQREIASGTKELAAAIKGKERLLKAKERHQTLIEMVKLHHALGNTLAARKCMQQLQDCLDEEEAQEDGSPSPPLRAVAVPDPTQPTPGVPAAAAGGNISPLVRNMPPLPTHCQQPSQPLVQDDVSRTESGHPKSGLTSEDSSS